MVKGAALRSLSRRGSQVQILAHASTYRVSRDEFPARIQEYRRHGAHEEIDGEHREGNPDLRRMAEPGAGAR